MSKVRAFIHSLVSMLALLFAWALGIGRDFARALFISTAKLRALRLQTLASYAALLSLLLAHSGPSQAQVFFSNLRVSNAIFTHSTVGTSTAAAISPSAVSPGLLGWKICNDAVNTSTYLLVGEAVDVSTDGRMLGPGKCHECPNCSPATLKAVKVEAQAASNGYSVVQYKQ